MTEAHQRFFDELAPRLETAQSLEHELDTHLARRFNVFDYLRTDELGLSRVVADLLNPKGKHGQGAIFLRLMLDGCGLQAHLARLEAHDAVEVEVEKAIKDNRRLDIFVRIGGRCLAIENKPYAGDQPRQVGDYLEWLRDSGFEKYALIYLSPSGEGPSSESVKPPDLDGIEDGSHFKIMPYHGAGEGEWEDGFDDCRLGYTLAEWFSDCRKNCKVERLCWFFREAEAFCEDRFGGRTVGSSQLETISKFIVSDENKWGVGLEIHRAYPQIMQKVSLEFLMKIRDTFPQGNGYEYPADMLFQPWYHSWYHSSKIKTSLAAWRKSWKSTGGGGAYRTVKQYTQIRVEAVSEIDSWGIGLKSYSLAKDRAGHMELKASLTNKLGSSEENWEGDGWLWWQYIDERYRNWSSIIPTLHRECEEGSGEALMCFVEKLADVAEVAVPIIDRYEGT